MSRSPYEEEGSAASASDVVESDSSTLPPLPILSATTHLNIEAIRDRYERYYLRLLLAIGLLLVACIIWAIELLAFASAEGPPASAGGGILSLVPFTIIFTIAGLAKWFYWKMLLWRVQGDGIEVSSHQYPQVYRLVKEASDRLGLNIVPRVIVLQGHGEFQLTVLKQLSRRGLIVITSNVMDRLTQRPASQELMMLVGMQVGHIAAGHYRHWILKHVIAKYVLFILYQAWWRRCQFTADKVGLLLAGEYDAAARAMYIMAAGAGLAPGTSADEILQQRARLLENRWAWYTLLFSSSPFMVDRLFHLRKFSRTIATKGQSEGVGAVPLHHLPLRSRPVLIIHGHDRAARLELENFIFAKLPYVTPRVMVEETTAALSIPEKFDLISVDLSGAIALLTPDDMVQAVSTDTSMRFRARQNVILEIGWVWARLGRRRCLLLVQGDIEIPSDLSGVEVHRYANSPKEQSETIRAFISSL